SASPHAASRRSFAKPAHRGDAGRLAAACECPRRDSNPCYRLERPASWASRRRGLRRTPTTNPKPGGNASVRPGPGLLPLLLHLSDERVLSRLQLPGGEILHPLCDAPTDVAK